MRADYEILEQLLRRVLSNATLFYEELHIVLSDCESMIIVHRSWWSSTFITQNVSKKSRRRRSWRLWSDGPTCFTTTCAISSSELTFTSEIPLRIFGTYVVKPFVLFRLEKPYSLESTIKNASIGLLVERLRYFPEKLVRYDSWDFRPPTAIWCYVLYSDSIHCNITKAYTSMQTIVVTFENQKQATRQVFENVPGSKGEWMNTTAKGIVIQLQLVFNQVNL